MAKTQHLSASLEDYLEAIFHIVAEKQVARAKDIASRLGVTHSSVTGALRSLSGKKLINYAPYEIITLTPEGKKLAGNVVRRHETLYSFLIKVLKIDEAEAEDAACRLEHAIPETVLERLIKFIEFLELCPRGDIRWIEESGYYCLHGELPKGCERCVSLSAAETETTMASENDE